MGSEGERREGERREGGEGRVWGGREGERGRRSGRRGSVLFHEKHSIHSQRLESSIPPYLLCKHTMSQLRPCFMTTHTKKGVGLQYNSH